MTVTVTDLFCGAGGSSLGAEAVEGVELKMAANHWSTAIDVHQAHFPNAGHDCADISQADPRRYPRTDILLASPECTNHSQARGVSRKKQDTTLWDAPDASAERSRATMWDVPRFAEQMRYAAVVVENVVEATKWVMWPAWWQAMELLGYSGQVLSHNSMHHGVAQSRDRIYVVWTRHGLNVDLETERTATCPKCDQVRTVRQFWKNGRTVGRYGPQWVWGCTVCGTACPLPGPPAASIIDWDLPCPRIGDRARPLAAKTRDRIYAGLQRFGWAHAVTTSGAGNVYETTPGNRARTVDEPLPTQQTTLTSALATPPTSFAINTAHGGRLHDVEDPHPTVCASDDRLSLVVHLRGTAKGQVAGSCTPVGEPVRTVSAGGTHLGLVVSNNHSNVPQSTESPLSTVTTGNRHGLLMRNNTGGAEMVTPVDEPARTVTTAGNQSLLLPYNRTANARLTDDPMPTVTTRDGAALVDPETVVDDCGFRMLEPYEVAAAMAFPTGYIPRDLTKKDQVKLAGNAVTPPVMQFLVARITHALESQ